MTKIFRLTLINLGLLLSLNAKAQLQIVAAGPTDLCFNTVTLSIVNPPANCTFEWFVGTGTCFDHVLLPFFSNTTSIQAFGTGGHYCIATDINGVQQISNSIFVRVLPGSIGSAMLPLPYSSNQVACLSSVDFCIPIEMAPPGFTTTIKWFRNNVQIAGASSAVYTATLGGYYKYSITNSCATSYSDSVEFISPSSVPQFTTTAVSPVCNGNTINFTATNPIPGATYTWQTSNFPSSGFVASGSGTSFSYIVPSATNLYVRLQCVFTGCGVQISPAVGFTIQNISRQISPFGTQNLCPGGAVNLTVNVSGGSTSLQWMKNGTAIPGAISANYTATTTGVYRVDVTAACGVAASNDVGVSGGTTPNATVTPAGPTTFCAGESVTLNANTGAGLTYQWKKYGNNIAGATGASYIATGAGVYKVTVTNAGGCSANSSNVTVNVNALPTATISAAGSTAICPGSSVNLNANTGSGLTYQWRKYSNDIVGATNSTYAVTGAGQYKVKVTNANGCSKNSNTITVTSLPAPTATITANGPTTFCQGDSVKLTANSGAGLSYQWKKGSNNIAGATLLNYSAKNAGNYKVTVTGSNGCSKNSNVIAVNVPCRMGDETYDDPEFQIHVFPNPSIDIFNVSSDMELTNLSVMISDITGRKINPDIQFISNHEFIIKNIEPGIYLLKVEGINYKKVIKLIKTN